MNKPNRDRSLDGALGALGLLSLVSFFIVFLNTPWEWSMFMDDTLYNSWMPKIGSFRAAFVEEIRNYWSLGRFYPVKYLANLLKWRYLPNDPFVFRCCNLAAFLASVFFGSLAAMRAGGLRPFRLALVPILVFLMGGALLHKPLLETVSLNPIGETWVCLFFALGAFCLFSENGWVRSFGARAFFVLVALSKEPAALVFFASSAHYGLLAWKAPVRQRRRWALEAAVDLALFLFFMSVAFHVMSQGWFTKHAYFAKTPWLMYGRDFIYKIVRYGLWTSPFLAAFFFARKELKKLLLQGEGSFRAGALFFSVMGLSYLVFMSTQGRTAYQEIPASMALFCLFGLLLVGLLKAGVLSPFRGAKGVAVTLLFSLSFFISVSRWQRFVLGFVEPRRAMENLLDTGDDMTILIPVGELYGHIEQMIKDRQKHAKVFQIDETLAGKTREFTGKVFTFEFPYYMGDLPADRLTEVNHLVSGWETKVDAGTYRIYVGKQRFPVSR